MTENSVVKKHPRALYVLFLTEMWERFGYYLMVGILLLYLLDNKTGGKGFPAKEGADIVGSFIALVYLTPFIGGLVADRYLGYIKSILIGGILMACGYIGLAFPGNTAMYISLGLIIVGNGFFKPNISTILGNIYNKEELRPMKDNAYNIFYMGINIGAFVCNFVAAYLRNNYGWGYAFAAAGIGMIIALCIFAGSIKHIKEGDIKKEMQKEDMPTSKILLYVFLPAILTAIIGWIVPTKLFGSNLFGSQANDAFIFACIPIIIFYVSLWFHAKGKDKRGIGALLFIYAVSLIFWTIYNQNSTGLTIWAESYTNRTVTPTTQKLATKLGMLEKVSDTARKTDSLNAYMVPVKDPKGNIIQVMGPDPYYANVPPSERPVNHKENLVNAELFQSINPLCIVLFTVLFVKLFAYLRARKREPTTASKFGMALFISGTSSLIMILAILSVPSIYGFKTSPGWLWLTYAVFTISEIMLSPIGLSLVSKLAPPRLTALMMGGWFLSTSIGGKLAGVMTSYWDNFTDKKLYFLILVIAAIIGGVLIFSRIKTLNEVVREKTGNS